MDLGPFGYKSRNEDYEYERDKKRKETFSQPKNFFEEEQLPREIVKNVMVKAPQAIPRWEDEEIEPLKRVASEVVGSLFDRVKFLRERIDDCNDSIDIRKGLHQDMIKEIDVDIMEKVSMEMKAIDIDEKRNLKLDISLLRKEKRTEGVRFWRDMMELKTELKELLENYQSESRTAALFGKEDEAGQDNIKAVTLLEKRAEGGGNEGEE